jgi:hypothetical protein
MKNQLNLCLHFKLKLNYSIKRYQYKLEILIRTSFITRVLKQNNLKGVETIKYIHIFYSTKFSKLIVSDREK